MKNNVYEFKKKTFHSEEKGLHAKSLIDLDQPFDYEEVAAITGSEYVRYLHREGMPFISYEELKRNVADLRVKAVERPKYTMVSGFQFADDCYHHIGHSWVYLVDEDTVRIGIDDFTTKVFGPADKIALPAVGSALKQGEVGWVLTRNGHEAPMQAPVSGTVSTVNNKMKERPEIVHRDPYEAGWLFLLEPFRLEDDLKELYFGEACLQWLEEENQSLLELLAPRYERLAATGGGLVDDIYGHFPEIDWGRLVKTFLRTEVKS